MFQSDIVKDTVNYPSRKIFGMLSAVFDIIPLVFHLIQNKDECKEKVGHHLSKPRLEHLVRLSDTLKDMMLSRLNGSIIELT